MKQRDRLMLESYDRVIAYLQEEIHALKIVIGIIEGERWLTDAQADAQQSVDALKREIDNLEHIHQAP